MSQKIVCPQCRTEISIDDVLTHQIEENIRRQYIAKEQAKEAEFAEREKNLKSIIDNQVAASLKLETAKLKTQINQEKQQEFDLLAEQLAQKEHKLEEAQKAELALRKEKIRLEEDKKSFEVEKQRQLDLERQKIMADAAKQAFEEQQYKLMELSKQLNDAKEVNEELRRKLQQGSQQTQGEVLELEIEELLRREFPTDTIVPVGKGINGADVVQKVCDRYGRLCGTIVWESKHTKNWTEGWIQKLKDDQLREKADIAVLVSTTLPKDHSSFNLREGVWVTDVTSVIGLAVALRLNLIQLMSIKQSSVGKNEKMEILYSYLTGSEFRQRIEGIVKTFTAMQADLDQERRAYHRIWEKREKQINRVIENTVSMYGDLEGITGQSLPKIDTLELPE